MNNKDLIQKLVRRIEALETERLLKSKALPVPTDVFSTLNDTNDAVQEAKRLDWVSNIGI